MTEGQSQRQLLWMRHEWETKGLLRFGKSGQRVPLDDGSFVPFIVREVGIWVYAIMNENQTPTLATPSTSIEATAAGDPSDSPGVIMFPPALWAATVLLGLVMHYFWRWHIMATVPAWCLASLGALMIVLGGSLAIWGRNTMVRGGTNVLPSRPALAIITAGPFRFTRNPLYLGNLLVYVGLTLIFNSAELLALFLPMYLLLHWGIVRREERYLEGKFGAAYLAYKASVRRWI